MQSQRVALLASGLLLVSCAMLNPHDPANYRDDEWRSKRTPERFEAVMKEWREVGYSPMGKPFELNLSQEVRVPVQLKGLRCYFVAIRLKPGAKFSDSADDGILLNFAPKGEEPVLSVGAHVYEPGALAYWRCLLQDMSYELSVEPDLVLPGRNPGLGDGPFTLQIYWRSAPPEELDALRAERARKLDAIKNKKIYERCDACIYKYQWCKDARLTFCTASFNQCIYREFGAKALGTCSLPD